MSPVTDKRGYGWNVRLVPTADTALTANGTADSFRRVLVILRRPPCARRSTRANKLRSRTRLKSRIGAAETSSAKAGLPAATGITATIGGTGRSSPGVSSGAREVKVRLHSPRGGPPWPMAHYVEYLLPDSLP